MIPTTCKHCAAAVIVRRVMGCRMSIDVMGRVWRKSSFRGTKLLALIALADWADDDGYSWYGVDKISKKIRLERRQTVNILQTLAKSGEIVIYRHVAWGGANLYWLAVGVRNFAPPPEQFGLTVKRPPIYRGGKLLHSAILLHDDVQVLTPDTSLTVIEGVEDLMEEESSPPEDSVRENAPDVRDSALVESDEQKMIEGFLRVHRVSKKRRKAIHDAGVTFPYVQKWFVYAEIRGFDVGLAIVNILDHLPEPEFCDYCAGVDSNHQTVGGAWGEPCPRSNNGKLTTKECEETTGTDRAVELAGVE